MKIPTKINNKLEIIEIDLPKKFIPKAEELLSKIADFEEEFEQSSCFEQEKITNMHDEIEDFFEQEEIKEFKNNEGFKMFDDLMTEIYKKLYNLSADYYVSEQQKDEEIEDLIDTLIYDADIPNYIIIDRDAMIEREKRFGYGYYHENINLLYLDFQKYGKQD